MREGGKKKSAMQLLSAFILMSFICCLYVIHGKTRKKIWCMKFLLCLLCVLARYVGNDIFHLGCVYSYFFATGKEEMAEKFNGPDEMSCHWFFRGIWRLLFLDHFWELEKTFMYVIAAWLVKACAMIFYFHDYVTKMECGAEQSFFNDSNVNDGMDVIFGDTIMNFIWIDVLIILIVWSLRVLCYSFVTVIISRSYGSMHALSYVEYEWQWSIKFKRKKFFY